MGEASNNYHLIKNKLNRILEATQQTLIIFIDGWNEADLQVAKAIDIACDRLAKYNIKIIISMTNNAAQRLLLDESGNPSNIAEAISIPASSVPRLEINPEKIESSWSVVYIPDYDKDEVEKAYAKYSNAYKANIPENHHKTNEPFLLRIAMEQFSKKMLPETLDESKLIEFSLQNKMKRVIGLAKTGVTQRLLKSLASNMFDNDAPISEELALQQWGYGAYEETSQGLFEAALLSRSGIRGNDSLLDFYYGRERDFAISLWARQWDKKFSTPVDLKAVQEIEQAIKTNAGTDALRWFLSQRNNLEALKVFLDTDSLLEKPDLYSIFLRCLGTHFTRSYIELTEWLKNIIYKAIDSKYSLVKIEAVKFCVLDEEIGESIEAGDIIVNDDGSINKDIAISLLNIDEDYPLSTSSASSNIFYFFADLGMHENFISLGYEGRDNEENDLILVMEELLDHKISTLRSAASKVYGHIGPLSYLKTINSRVISSNENFRYYQANQEHANGLSEVLDILEGYYYGDICPGFLEGIKEDSEIHIAEYDHMYHLIEPIINSYSKFECSTGFSSLLKSLKPEYYEIAGEDCLEIDPQQLNLALDENDISYNTHIINNH